MYRTVTGLVSSKELNKTLIHEHLYVNPNDLPKYEDYTLDDINRSIAEVYQFKNSGGKTIVDLTPINYGRNPIALKQISEATSINIMFVTGFHKEEFHPNWLNKLTDSELYDFLLHEIDKGVTSHKLLPAAMKIGTSYKKITKTEKRVIELSAKVQEETGIPMITHCDEGTMGLEQLHLLKENGADLTKICLSHVDLTKNIDYLKKICETGASISFDHIGRELENNDKDRILILKELINSGYGDKICLAGDMGRKRYFKSYGGKPGLDYILTDLKKYLLEEISLDNYENMIVRNPINFLAWER